MKKISTYLLAITFFLGACMNFEDPIKPEVISLELDASYGYLQNMQIKGGVFDNDGLASIHYRIQKAGNQAPEDWSVSFDTLINGKRFFFDFTEQVPSGVSLGTYLFTLRTTDIAGNQFVKQLSFRVTEPTLGPDFEAVAPSLPTNIASDYIACPGDAILFNGTITDPFGIESVSYRIEGFSPKVFSTEGLTSVDLATLSAIDPLTIPFSSTIGSFVTVHLRATNTLGLQSSVSFEVLLDCDNISPQIFIVQTSPTKSGDVIEALAGMNIRILDGILTDENSGLDSVWIYFNKLGASPNLVLVQSLFGVNSVNIDDVLFGFDDLFVIPTDASVGDIFTISLRCKDRAGNFSETKHIQINVVIDKIPVITITNVYANGNEIFSPYTTSVGRTITLDGKVIDDFYLSAINMRLFNPSAVLVSEKSLLIETGELSPIVNLSSLHGLGDFVVSGTGTYTLVVEAIDASGNIKTLSTNINVF